MSLKNYREKRSFTRTPEPEGKKKSSGGQLRFVVQKHDATNLHYDFRLELGGVLLSWAVPKGPSLDPGDKRLAMHVEDHPLDYADFEGIIPEGNYGAGTVIVWDEGSYYPFGGESLSKKEQEKELRKQYQAGKMHFVLHGKKLKGEFHIFLMKGRGERSWILAKKKDRYASGEDITAKDRSVKSRKTLAQIAKAFGTELRHREKRSKAAKGSRKSSATPASKSAKRRSSGIATAARKNKAARRAMPDQLTPMFATLVNEPFDDPEWIYEIKWDGYRALAYCNRDKIRMESRNRQIFTDKYSPVAEALGALSLEAVLDGEIVAVDEKGLASFQALQNWQNTPANLQYYVFDLLWAEGYDTTSLPLVERKKLLRVIIPPDDPVIRYSDHIEAGGKEFFKLAMSRGLEGIIAKKASGTYHPGARTRDWLKMKANLRQEVVIAGFTKPRNTRKHFGSLLLGVYDNGELRYAGHTGSGFNAAGLEEIHGKLVKMVTDKSPFKTPPKTNMPATWVKPVLVCEIKFTEWTRDGIARHPIFMGLRTDKKAKDVKAEKAVNLAVLKKKAGHEDSSPVSMKTARGKTSVKKTAKTKKRKVPEAAGMKQEIPVEAKEHSMKMNGHILSFTNLKKIFWKKEKFTKGDVIRYYLEMIPWLLPHMLDRPQSLNRHPNGIDGKSFYQKDMAGKVPGWMKTHRDYSESSGKTTEYLVCSNEATLLYMANLGCIELHPWHSRSRTHERPDWCLVDLDPDISNSFEQVMEVAKLVKDVLDSIGAEAYCKTSGSSGIHIYIPLGAKYDFEQSRQLAELVVTLVHHEMPGITSLERSPARRRGMIYLDYLQNRQIQTAAAPYSLRPKPGVPVSTPLDWSELKRGLKPASYNARNIFARVKSEGDLFAPVLGKGINLSLVLKRIASLAG